MILADLISLVLGTVIFVGLVVPVLRKGRQRVRLTLVPRRATAIRPNVATRGGRRSATAQLDCVLASDFRTQTLLSQREARVAATAEAILSELAPTWRICPQVALGEALRADGKSAYWAVNAKRCDMMIVDEHWQPVAALEYQGTGHHQDDAAARDAVKREALRRAGVDWIEVTEGDRAKDLRGGLERLVRGRARGVA